MSPGDPSVPANGTVNNWNQHGATSYASNAYIFQASDGGVASIPKSFPDGQSNTIVFAEKYAVCSGVVHAWADMWDGPQNGQPAWCNCFYWQNYPEPATNNLPLPQFQPSVSACNPNAVQGPYAGGIMVGLGDGSVRLVNSGVSQQTWSFAVYPDDGQPLGSDW